MNRKIQNIVEHATVEIFDTTDAQIGVLSHRPNMTEGDIRTEIIDVLENYFNSDVLDIHIDMCKEDEELSLIINTLVIGSYNAEVEYNLSEDDEDYSEELARDGKVTVSGLLTIELSKDDVEELLPILDISEPFLMYITPETSYKIFPLMFLLHVIYEGMDEEEYYEKLPDMLEEMFGE